MFNHTLATVALTKFMILAAANFNTTLAAVVLTKFCRWLRLHLADKLSSLAATAFGGKTIVAGYDCDCFAILLATSRLLQHLSLSATALTKGC